MGPRRGVAGVAGSVARVRSNGLTKLVSSSQSGVGRGAPDVGGTGGG